MTNRLQLGLVVLVANGLAGCGAEAVRSSVPSAPSAPTPPPAELPIAQQMAAAGLVFNPTRTLSGFVYEVVEGGEAPIEGVRVYCEPCTEETHSDTYTDKSGFYTFTGVWGNAFSIWVTKDGYGDPPGSKPNTGFPRGPGWRDVTINGDTRFNIELARK